MTPSANLLAFQDLAMTVPAFTAGDPVRAVVCRWTGSRMVSRYDAPLCLTADGAVLFSPTDHCPPVPVAGSAADEPVVVTSPPTVRAHLAR